MKTSAAIALAIALSPAPIEAGVARRLGSLRRREGRAGRPRAPVADAQRRVGRHDGPPLRRRNEVVAFQVIVEADARGIAALSVALPELRRRGGGARIAYAAPGPILRPRDARSSSSPSTT